ncbi:uncharacterized protein E0L32_001665 [Thyridium curvatum]|uniref:Uncharacterized protein n=1 Tax=Thyridium curvatum TaxID=1093900 RepID=A0A507AH40_9PEZI|nr:uncharacterized protein E0L32_001533 [Thyridium curvatum]XP_030990916.1 uncharacterized protein E0L32_001665 [Thyridium curvatum]TPX09073.1 hypothetical protein E0L32_001533 [Thyridium curvatum]TPX09205.1 hypothetical protein E0L32_001665 [Thyridium curvatum]
MSTPKKKVPAKPFDRNDPEDVRFIKDNPPRLTVKRCEAVRACFAKKVSGRPLASAGGRATGEREKLVKFGPRSGAHDAQWMALKVRVDVTRRRHLKDRIGLVQNVLASRRVATYAGAPGTGVTEVPLPVLDGAENEAPFYGMGARFDTGAAARGAARAADDVYIQDGPTHTVPVLGYVRQGAGKYATVDLERVEVREEFGIWLYNATKKITYRHWTWGYSYVWEAARDEQGDWSFTRKEFSATPPTLQDENPTRGPVRKKLPVAVEANRDRWTGKLVPNPYIDKRDEGEAPPDEPQSDDETEPFSPVDVAEDPEQVDGEDGDSEDEW